MKNMTEQGTTLLQDLYCQTRTTVIVAGPDLHESSMMTIRAIGSEAKSQSIVRKFWWRAEDHSDLCGR